MAEVEVTLFARVVVKILVDIHVVLVIHELPGAEQVAPFSFLLRTHATASVK